jgi:hypothetical protein
MRIPSPKVCRYISFHASFTSTKGLFFTLTSVSFGFSHLGPPFYGVIDTLLFRPVAFPLSDNAIVALYYASFDKIPTSKGLGLRFYRFLLSKLPSAPTGSTSSLPSSEPSIRDPSDSLPLPWSLCDTETLNHVGEFVVSLRILLTTGFELTAIRFRHCEELLGLIGSVPSSTDIWKAYTDILQFVFALDPLHSDFRPSTDILS